MRILIVGSFPLVSSRKKFKSETITNTLSVILIHFVSWDGGMIEGTISEVNI